VGCRIFAIVVLALAAVITAQAAPPPISTERSPSSSTVVEPIPPPVVTRYARLQARLQPSARAWFAQQARAARGSITLNVPAIEAAIRSRFRILPDSPAVDQGVFIEVVMRTDQSARDGQTIAAQMNRLKDARQKVVGLISEVQRERAGNLRGNPDPPCRSPLCQSLPGRIRETSNEAAGAGHALRLSTSGSITWSRLGEIENQLNAASSDLDSFTQIEQLRLQMLMDRRSKFLETLSNILKKIDATDDSVVQSMK
jgi:hypothetical protein